MEVTYRLHSSTEMGSYARSDYFFQVMIIVKDYYCKNAIRLVLLSRKNAVFSSGF